jgi:hypothetical protein
MTSLKRRARFARQTFDLFQKITKLPPARSSHTAGGFAARDIRI